MASRYIFIIVVVFIFLRTNEAQKYPNRFEASNEFLRQTYCNSDKLVKMNRDVLRISGPLEMSYIEIQSQIAANRDARSIEITNMPLFFDTLSNITIVEVFFDPMNRSQSNLKCLNLSSNGISDRFLETPDYSIKKTLDLRLLQLTGNKLKHLEKRHFIAYESAPLEAVLLDYNQISSVRHDTFASLRSLKYLGLNNNKIKLIHPLTFSQTPNLLYVNLAYNRLQAIFKTTESEFVPTNFTLKSLKYFYLNGNDEITCDCGLLWLYKMRDKLKLDDFRCNANIMKEGKNQTSVVFRSLESQQLLVDNCPSPQIYVDTKLLEKSSSISLIREMSKRWFAWNLFPDELPTTTPFPYLRSNESIVEEELKRDSTDDILIDNQERHVFQTWQYDDAVFECSTKPNSSSSDLSKSTIIWKTQFGYLSYLDKELMDAIKEDQHYDTNEIKNYESWPNYNSFKIFYKLNKLTKIYKNLTVRVAKKFGTETRSMIYVRGNNHLVVTNMRQALSGPFVCIALNERSMKIYEYDIHVRSGVSEYFIYSLVISALAMIIPSIIGLIVCCMCEYQADRNYPMTPPCYPTPVAATPPNFDFNEWMSNAYSYLPDFNIQETLEQVSKRLRKGMEKASVTVKSLGVTSSAYIYSMYEQSSQRWSDIKQFVPTLNVPNLTLPTMRYPANMGQLANRMRMGMGNVFIHFREFCGTTDMTHTPSIVDLDAETNASSAVPRNYILDELKQQNSNRSNYYRFLSLIKEESRLNSSAEANINSKKPNEDQPVVGDTNPDKQSSGSSSSSASTTSDANQSKDVVNTLPILTDIKSISNKLNENESNVYIPNDSLSHDDDDDDDTDDDDDDEQNTKKNNNGFIMSLRRQSENELDEINDRTAKIDPKLINANKI